MKDRILFAVIVTGAVVTIIGAALIFARLAGFAEELRNANVEGCKRQNEVRKAERHGLKNDIAEGRAGIEEDKAIPPSFFPDIPPEEFKRLIEQGIREARENIAEDRRVIQEIQPAPCESLYPQP